MSAAATRPEGPRTVELRAPDGACARVALHGAQVLSWRAAGSDAEQLYLSPRSAYGDGQAIRGGVPLIFPQFSNRGPLAKHGFARNLAWRLESAEGGRARFTLTDDEATRAAWPHAFALACEVAVGGDALRITLGCTNRGTEAFAFTAALHTYLRVAAIEDVWVEGLEDRPWYDAVDAQDRPAAGRALRIQGEVDRVYAAVPRALTVQEGAAAARGLQVAQEGFADVVVWNPGAAKAAALGDMPPEDFRHMLCIESAQVVTPVQLAPGMSWRGLQTLRRHGT